MDIALVMVHGSPAAHRHLVTIFAREHLGLETSGTFQQELATIVDAIAQLLAEQEQAKRLEAEAKRIAEAEAKRIADAKRIAEAEAKKIAEAEAYAVASANFVLVPQKILNDQEWKNSFRPGWRSNITELYHGDEMNVTTFGQLHAVFSTLLYHLQQGNVRGDFRWSTTPDIVGVEVGRSILLDKIFLFFFARKILREAGMDFATAKRGDVEDAFLRLYPQYEPNVQFESGTRYVRLPSVYAAYALHHGTPDMFPSLSRAKFDTLRANNMRGVYGINHYPIVHCYLMATAPDYVEFIKALRPYYIPNWLKR
ncbi:MAG: hypothetical protein EAY65_05030 [Alphaproteobacteria bacterium]|nr:MAG: hypothetical protein EAY65_05030 [Alphaproteobacteria bacterium]